MTKLKTFLLCMLLAASSFGAALNSPSNLQVSNIKDTQVTLTWKDNANAEKELDVYVSKDSTNWNFLAPGLPKNSTTKTVSGLTPLTTYYFKVAAVNGGKSSYSPVVSASTLDFSNHLAVGDFVLISNFADNNQDGLSAFVVRDGFSAYAVVYDRDRNFNVIPLPNVTSRDVSLGAEVAFLGDRIIIAGVSFLQELHVWEYQLVENHLVLLQHIVTGDANTRWPEILKTTDNRVVVEVYEQGAGIVGWFLHRNANGIWVDDGKQILLFPGIDDQPAGNTRLTERPDHTVWAFGIKDSWGSLNGFNLTFEPFNIVTNVQILQSGTVNGAYPDGLMTIHGEIPFFFKATTDWTNNRIVLAYQDEERSYLAGNSLAKISLTAFNPDDSKNLVDITPGVVERTVSNYALNIVNGKSTLYYVPMTEQDFVWPYTFRLTRYSQGQSDFQMKLDWWTSIIAHRNYNDVIGRRYDGQVVIIFN